MQFKTHFVRTMSHNLYELNSFLYHTAVIRMTISIDRTEVRLYMIDSVRNNLPPVGGETRTRPKPKNTNLKLYRRWNIVSIKAVRLVPKTIDSAFQLR